MKLKKTLQPLYIILSCNQVIIANPIITVFLRPFPTAQPEQYAQNVNNKLSKPGKIAQYNLYDKMTYIPTGIFATYLGFVALSDSQGQLTFPRKHPAPKISLLVTEYITPIRMLGNTLTYWKIEEDSPAEMYVIERKQDTETALFYWDVQPKTLPKNNIIEPDTLILIAKPQYIVIPIGISLTDDSTNLILPDIYIKRGIEKLSNALFILNMNQFFSPLGNVYNKTKPDRYSSRLKIKE